MHNYKIGITLAVVVTSMSAGFASLAMADESVAPGLAAGYSQVGEIGGGKVIDISNHCSSATKCPNGQHLEDMGLFQCTDGGLYHAFVCVPNHHR